VYIGFYFLSKYGIFVTYVHSYTFFITKLNLFNYCKPTGQVLHTILRCFCNPQPHANMFYNDLIHM
jgi:hypothetical protein